MKNSVSNKTYLLSQAKQIEFLKRETERTLPKVYAAFAIVLHGKGWNTEDIENLFAETQSVWNEVTQNGENIIKKCDDETDICLYDEYHAERLGLTNGENIT